MKVEDLKNWFQERPVWLQIVAKQIIEKGILTDEEDYKVSYMNCIKEAKKQLDGSEINIPIDHLLNSQGSDNKIKLKSIENVKGINALSPKKPLDFGDKNLVIIYGLNASGKSGYVRILKHVCGAIPCSPLLPDVYNSNPNERKCTIKYNKDNEIKEKEWLVSYKPIEDLKCVDIFDSEKAKSYIINENEVTYEPKVLSFFSHLVNVCEKISREIKKEIDQKPSKKPLCPSEYKDTEGARWYNEKLSASTTEEDINKYCSWTEDNRKKLGELQKRLNQENPQKKAEDLRKKNKNLEELISNTNMLLGNLSDEKYGEINELKKKYSLAKKITKECADKVFKEVDLKGVGSDTWRKLWLYAKEYSEKVAYKGLPFPVLSDEALCVLCHQKLDEDAKSRFTSFEGFVKGEAQENEEQAKKMLENTINELPVILGQEHLKTKLDAVGLQEVDNSQLKNLYIELENRKKELSSPDIKPEIKPLPSIEEWKKQAKEIITKREDKAQQYDKDAKDDNRESLLIREKELKIREWLLQQVDSIKKDVERKKEISILQSAKDLTDTRSLSKKKSALSEELITEDFVRRFNSELQKLKADNIKVEIVKSRTERGKVYHQIELKNKKSNKVKTIEILSEGEARVVALSTFLADVIGGNSSAPFVFDDPISSLDQDFEEAVVQRLVELSEKRQVIVFTHRLSMFSLLEEEAKNKKVGHDIFYLNKEPWGTGEPGDIPLFAKNPAKALNILIKRLSEAEIILENEGQEKYNEKANSFIVDFRKIIENVIESVLLRDIVKRYRKGVYSKKVKELSKITEKDLKIIDDLMSKHSKFLHHSSEETPVQIPKPQELKQDFEKLKSWITEFNKRTNSN